MNAIKWNIYYIMLNKKNHMCATFVEKLHSQICRSEMGCWLYTEEAHVFMVYQINLNLLKRAAQVIFKMTIEQFVCELKEYHFLFRIDKSGVLYFHHQLFIRNSSKYMLSLIQKEEQIFALYIVQEKNQLKLLKEFSNALSTEDLVNLDIFESLNYYI